MKVINMFLKNMFKVLRVIAILACFILFIANSLQSIQDFFANKVTLATQVKKSSGGLKTPGLTFCHLPPYKSHMIDYSKSLMDLEYYKNITYSFEDLFSAYAFPFHNNSIRHELVEIATEQYGRCHVLTVTQKARTGQ